MITKPSGLFRRALLFYIIKMNKETFQTLLTSAVEENVK